MDKVEFEKWAALKPVASLTISHFRGHLENRELDYYGDLPDGTHKLYTRPDTSDELRKAAEEVVKISDRWRGQLPYGLIVHLENLRAALEKK